MNADDMLDILTLKEAVKILQHKATPPHIGMKEHDGYAPHSHEVRADHEGVPTSFPVGNQNANAIRWLTEMIKWIKEEEKT